MKKILLLLTLVFSVFFFQSKLNAQTLETDSLALLCLYIDYDGPNWTNNNNWLTTEPLDTWHGITVSSNRVTKIDLSNNNLVGSVLSGFDNMNALNQLILNDNSISGITSLSSMSSLNRLIVHNNLLVNLPAVGSSVLLDLTCHNNRLDFGDLEPVAGMVVGNFQYSPQANIGEERFQYFLTNSTVNLSVDVGGQANLYFWLKDGQPVNPSPSTVPDLTIPNANIADEGAYVVEITNNQLPNLILESEPVHLRRFVRDSLGGEYVPNQLIIEFTADASQFERDTMLDYYDAERLDICMCGILELWQLPDTSITPQGEIFIGIEGVKEDAISKAKVEEADKNYLMRLLDSGSGIEEKAAKTTYELLPPPNSGIVDDIIPVALIDVGIDTTVSIIYPWLWSNEEESSDNADNDGNCLIDDTRGYNFVDRNNAPMDAVHGHGTHLAGIISNGLPDTDIRLINIKTHDDNGLGLLFEATCAIYYAAQKEAKVINLSWGYRGEAVAVLENAIARAGEDCGAMIVASAGNENLDNDSFPHYPSSYELDNIISVAALNFEENDLLTASNFGIQSVDIAAPGDSISSTLPNPQGFGFKSGTSMAAAAVSRAAALLFKENPDATYLNVIDALLSTAMPLPALDSIASGGKLDLDTALDFIQTVETDTACSNTVGIALELNHSNFNPIIYPQPFYNFVTIELDTPNPNSAEIIIVDAIGRVVFRKIHEFSAFNKQLIWNGKTNSGTELPGGIYFGVISLKNQISSFRLIKMNE